MGRWDKRINKLEAYQCSVCGQLYLDHKLTEGCVKKHLKYIKSELSRKRAIRNRNFYADYVRLHAETFDDIQRLLIEKSLEYKGITLKFDKFPVDDDFRFVSNTHGCPIGGVTNWHCKENLPRGYWGWGGRIEGIVTKKGTKNIDLHHVIGDFPHSINEGDYVFRGIHTGTGCGGDDFSIECYFFLDDFPLLKKNLREICIANTLSNLPQPKAAAAF